MEKIGYSSKEMNENWGIEMHSPSNEHTLDKFSRQKNYKNEDNTESKEFVPQSHSRNRIRRPNILRRCINQNESFRKMKNIPLNLKKIAVPKTDTLNVKSLCSFITSGQINVTPSNITLSSVDIKPATTTVSMLKPKSDIMDISTNKIISIQKHGLQINEITSQMLVVPHNNFNYTIQKPVEPSLISNTMCNKLAEQTEIICSANVLQLNDAKKISNFVMGVKKLPDKKYIMLAPPGQIPTTVKNEFIPISRFIKQKSDSNSTENENKVASLIPTPLINSVTKEINPIKKDSQVPLKEANCMEISSVNYINENTLNIQEETHLSSQEANDIEMSSVNFIAVETIQSKNELQESPKVTNSMITQLVNCMLVEPKNIKKEVEFAEWKVIEKPPSDYITEETGYVEKGSQEANSMKISISSFIDRIKHCEKDHNIQVSNEKAYSNKTQAIYNIKTPLNNSVIEETNVIQKTTQITPNQTNYMKIPSVNSNTVKYNHDKKKSQILFQSTSSNVIFKAPIINSNNRHKVIISCSTGNEKYAMKNIVDANNKLKLKAMSDQELNNSPEFVYSLPKIGPIIQTQNQPFIISRYDLNKVPKIKLNSNFNTNGKQMIKIEENKNNNKITSDEEIQLEGKPDRFSDRDAKQVVTEKSDVQFGEDYQSKKPIINRKMISENLKIGITKRKQMLPLTGLEKKTLCDNCDCLKKLETPCSKPPVNNILVNSKPRNNTCLNSLYETTPKELEERSFLKLEQTQKMQLEMKKLDEKTLNYVKKFTSAPKKLFDKPFPTEKSYFKVGHKLEGIDPEHEALFCAMTIVDTCGYRLKLHFDSYPANFDFWVNVDCPDIFYINWCKENNRTLQPPKGYKGEFDWHVYLQENCDATPAPKINFISTKNLCFANHHKLLAGLKLEALDKMTRTLTKQLICVATIADVVGDRIRIHFDGWTNDFDYWTEITSTNIHPIGWCDNNGRNLCPPNGYDDLKGKKPFKWFEYLKETNSEAAPESAFIRRPLREFTFNMAIEVVDLVVPSLIRIAVIIDVRGDELKILYDGFENKYAYWIEDDSPDIHPIGWCLKTNHPLEIPSDRLWGCKVVGCHGKGNVNVLRTSHFAIKDCPYEFSQWKKIVSGLQIIPDRLQSTDLDSITKRKRPRKSLHLLEKNQKAQKLNNNNSHEQKKRKICNKSNKMEIKRNVERGQAKIKINKMSIENIVKQTDEIECNAGRPIERKLNHSILGLKGRKWPNFPHLEMPKEPNGDVRGWCCKKVGSFVDKIVTLNTTYRSPDEAVSYSGHFIKRAIDGNMFLKLSQNDLTEAMEIPLGSALKIFNGILNLRRKIPELVPVDENLSIIQHT